MSANVIAFGISCFSFGFVIAILAVLLRERSDGRPVDWDMKPTMSRRAWRRYKREHTP